MSKDVIIKYPRGRMRLVLLRFFEDNGVTALRKLFNLLLFHKEINEEAIATLENFFLAWQYDFEVRLTITEQTLLLARQDEESKRRHKEAMGSALDSQIERAERRLESARYSARLKSSPELRKMALETVESRKAELERVSKPKTDYESAAKKVRELEKSIKQGKTSFGRCGKIINAYKTIKEKY
jgi:hypothetical protein